jgi:CheY-like chemotaxis protein
MDLPRKAILVVDDDYVIREALKMIFNPFYEVDTAESGGEAINRLQREQFDLVTLDIDMPGLSGLEILAQIKKRWPRLDVIMVSGQKFEECAAGYIRRRVEFYLETVPGSRGVEGGA